MKAFSRIFKYIWPQWGRVVSVILSSMLISLLLSVSFMAIIPLLTVMVGGEGLHGWVDRKTCESNYGLELHVPKAAELTEGTGPSLRTHLLVTRVEKDSLAEKAGFRPLDRIADVNEVSAKADQVEVSYGRLMQELAEATRETIPVRLKRAEDSQFAESQIELNTPYAQAYIESLNWSLFRNVKWHLQLAGLGLARWSVSFFPREQTPENQVRAVVAIMIAMLIITIVRCAAKFYQDYTGQKIVQVAVFHLRMDVFTHLTEMPVSGFPNERPSDTISRIMRDATIMSSALRVMLGKALREPMNALFMLGAAMVLNWKLSLVFLGGAPFVLALLATFGTKMKRATRRSLRAGAEMLGKLQEAVIGLRVVKIYNQQEYEQQQFRTIGQRLLAQKLRMTMVEAATHPVLEVLGMVAGAGAIIVGMAWVTTGSLDSPEFLALLALLGAAAEAVRKTSTVWNKIQEANAAAERVFAVLDQTTEVEDPNATILPPAKGNVEFRDIVFSYPNSERTTLKGINLTVQAGHNVAIVGSNGSGKTTLANLLPRFYDPDAGKIFIDGHDIAGVTLKSLRGQISMVTQNVITFNDTIRANIAYGRQGATEAEVIAVAKRAFAHDFVEQLPKGYDTVIGEHGTGLSGGQLQRIVIARAILKNPAILIFDEATSQVDADSEAKIHAAIEEIMRDRTTFVIAHRFSTVVAADVIVVMNDGQIIAQGQHEELMQTCPIYQGLYETQLVKT